MFERRLKVFLFVLAIVTAVLVARAVQLQVIERARWAMEAIDSLHHESLIETTRGRLLDVRGRPLAEDVYCFDACVDYRAIPPVPDLEWVHEMAFERVKARDGGHHDKSVSMHQLIADETAVVKADIDAMWARLADDGGMTTDQMDDLRQSIVHDVEMRRRYTWYRRYRLAQKAASDNDPAATQPITANSVEPWYRKWLLGQTDTAPVDSFDIKIGEQTEAHIILRSISSKVYNDLGKEEEHCPGLVLKPGMERSYPLPIAEAACHVLGRLTRVDENDLESDPWLGDDLRAYRQSDLIGRGGLEGLCEPLLRGTRGRVEEWSGDQTGSDRAGADAANQGGANDDKVGGKSGDGNKGRERIVEAVPGQDVQTTLDQDLEQDIRSAFDHVNVKREKTDVDLFADMHGAAVVIDVDSGEVRAMVSAPGFDPNELEQRYAVLAEDDLNHPLLNRATQAMLETGSTIKPVVGMGAITQGKLGINDTIECTGYFCIGGKLMAGGPRCWTVSKFPDLPISMTRHHQIPPEDPHPTGFLTFPEALQRSCNVFFGNLGDRLGAEGLSYWMTTFGLGRQTGVGISEVRGRLPDDLPISIQGYRRRNYSWLAAIGQGYVAATPIQMANVAATIARNGIWMRPRLVSDDVSRQLRAIAAAHPSTQPSKLDWTDVPDRADLKLNPAAVAAAQDGMFRVVNTIAGSGTALFLPNLEISGKTGTAQAAPFWVPVRDRAGKVVMNGSVPQRRFLKPSTTTQPSKEAPWYLGFDEKSGEELKHAWFIGYAPSHNPKIAFAVLVEYGGSGGPSAGGIAKQIIAACIKHGYVSLDPEDRTLVK